MYKNTLIVFCIIMMTCLIVAVVVSTGYDPDEPVHTRVTVRRPNETY